MSTAGRNWKRKGSLRAAGKKGKRISPEKLKEGESKYVL